MCVTQAQLSGLFMPRGKYLSKGLSFLQLALIYLPPPHSLWSRRSPIQLYMCSCLSREALPMSTFLDQKWAMRKCGGTVKLLSCWQWCLLSLLTAVLCKISSCLHFKALICGLNQTSLAQWSPHDQQATLPYLALKCFVTLFYRIPHGQQLCLWFWIAVRG